MSCFLPATKSCGDTQALLRGSKQGQLIQIQNVIRHLHLFYKCSTWYVCLTNDSSSVSANKLEHGKVSYSLSSFVVGESAEALASRLGFPVHKCTLSYLFNNYSRLHLPTRNDSFQELIGQATPFNRICRLTSAYRIRLTDVINSMLRDNKLHGGTTRTGQDRPSFVE